MKSTQGNPSRLQEALGSKYQVLRWIGGGGMAQVYLARNRNTGGLFAVKVLTDQLSWEDAIVARFLQEARTSAALSGHPNIVSIFDVGQFENIHYIIMQYVEGEDLQTYLKRRGKLPPEDAARIVEQIAEALVFAHSHVVVHRDLKPSNVKIQNSGRVVVLDFGIAKAGDAPSQLTSAGQCVGTPYYMSPEHFVGGTCDARSDLYSLGVVFFELLTGCRPFSGDSVQEIEAAHRTRPAPSPCDLDASIPEAYGRMVLRLLAKRPEDRYQSATALISDIRQTSENVSLEAAPANSGPAFLEVLTPTTPPAKTEKPATPRRVFISALAVAGMLLVAVVTAFVFRSMRTTAANIAPPATTEGAKQAAGRPASDSSFRVDAAVVANSAYKTFCDATGYPYPEPLPDDPNYFHARPDAPVLNVTYRDAAAFASWTRKRLPSEAEWDKAVGVAKQGSTAEWTSTRFTPSEDDRAVFHKLAGADPQGDWVVIKGDAPLRGLPSEWRPRGIAVGFRCVRDVPAR